MDNAAYHKKRPSSVPNVAQLKREEVFQELEKCGIEFNRSMSSVEAKKLLKTWQQRNVKAEIVSHAEDLGHEELFTPPYYSHLQPIEMLKAKVKN